VAERVRRLRSHALTSTTWDRHRGHADTYDVVEIGFNYRIDEPRAALALARLPRMATEIGRRRELTRTYRAELGSVPGLILPFGDEDVARSSCYIMPVMLRAPERRADLRATLRAHGIQTSILYPAIHQFSAYRERYPDVTLPQTEAAAACEVTLPLYPHMTEEEQGRVVAAVREALQEG
jgi:dTDP-4-amino-4,6-dideoxygalactose transaminase